jgi:hypothetical protein
MLQRFGNWGENITANNRATLVHLLTLAAFSAALFLPMMGRGFILDDFGHAFVAGQESIRFGLTRASGGPYYAPVAYGSFKIDWILWGARPFPWAVSNLLLHIANTGLLYFMVLWLWRSHAAAWWAGVGFAVLFPANVAAVMWIATRAHLIAALFYLAAMMAALWFARTRQFEICAGAAVVIFAALSTFAKESGVTVLGAVAIVILYERRRQGRSAISPSFVMLFAALFAVLLIYFALRGRSGAIPINFSGGRISYAVSLSVFWDNFLTYGWRTHGLLAFVAVAVGVSLRLRGLHPSLRSLTKDDVLLSVMLFAVAIAPVVLLPKQPGIYSYLPGISAAVLLGAVARSLCDAAPEGRRGFSPITLAPIIFVIVSYVALTVGYSLKWIQLAEINTVVLNQILRQQPIVKPNTFIVLSYAANDDPTRFPEGFGDWCFPWALRVLYMDRTVDGKIIRQGESYTIGDKLLEVRFAFIGGDTATVVKTGES